MKLWILILITGFLNTWQNNFTLQEKEISKSSPLPLIAKISVLTIHVSDTIVHDSVFHFLSDQLGLPVEYYPVRWGDRKYAAVFAGNMFLEPCGPFTNFKYARDYFKATFYGLNCESDRTISSLEQDLIARKIIFTKNNSIVITDTAITKQNLYFGISQREVLSQIKIKDEWAEDSLKVVLKNTTQNYAGIEAIKEVWIGYTGKGYAGKWNDLAKPGVISNTNIWKIRADQSIRFVKNDRMEVMGIVFKVRSLEKTRQFLMEKKLLGKSDIDFIELEPAKVFGLRVYFSE